MRADPPMTVASESVRLHLDPVSGPPIDCPPIAPDSGATLGRELDCDICLPDASVSRHHASIIKRGPHWYVIDLNSRNGVVLNTERLKANDPTPLDAHDLLAIEPWTFRIILGEVSNRSSITTEDQRASARVERISPSDLRLAQHRLHLLIDCAAVINAALDTQALADAVLQSALDGTGFHRACLIRAVRDSDDVELLGYRSQSDQDSDLSFSRSLVRMASSGELARLTSDASVPVGASIGDLRITEAICAPIFVGSSISAYLYLDNRGEEAAVQPDAATFCQVIARICGLSLANLKRADLQKRQDQILSELSAARDAQQLIMPKERGTVNGVKYAMRMRPGRFVAGDLFDVVELDGGRAAVCVGDVTGEGIGAGVLMASVQAHLHGALLQHGEPAAALNAVNQYIAERSAPDKFVSMWIGVFDLAAKVVRYVDAGHGHWLYRPEGEPPRLVRQGGGIPVGIDGSIEYETQQLPISGGDRVIVFSDGIVEQGSPSREQFGHNRIIETLQPCRTAEQDVDALFRAVEEFASMPDLSDDATVVSIECGPAAGPQ